LSNGSSLRAQTRRDLPGDVLDGQCRYLKAVNGVLAAAAAIFAPKVAMAGIRK
jgi:hypothetical protein